MQKRIIPSNTGVPPAVTKSLNSAGSGHELFQTTLRPARGSTYAMKPDGFLHEFLWWGRGNHHQGQPRIHKGPPWLWGWDSSDTQCPWPGLDPALHLPPRKPRRKRPRWVLAFGLSLCSSPLSREHPRLASQCWAAGWASQAACGGGGDRHHLSCSTQHTTAFMGTQRADDTEL